MAQLVEINGVWSGATFHCPACGEPVFICGEPALECCPHVMFSWIDMVGDYYNVSKSFRQIIKQYEDSDELEPGACDTELLDKLPENAVAFAFTEKGLACGPVSTTVVHCIEFPSEKDE